MNSFNKALQKLCNAIFKGFYLFAAFTFTVITLTFSSSGTTTLFVVAYVAKPAS